MCKFSEQVRDLEFYNSKIDHIKSSLSEAVNKVAKKIYEMPIDTNRLDGTTYDRDRVLKILFGTDCVPLNFDDFRVDGDIVVASGTFYGARGWTSEESVMFPLRWTELSDERLAESIAFAWDTHVQYDYSVNARSQEQAKEVRRKQFLELQKEFEND